VPHQTGVAEPAPVGEVIRPEWPKAAVSGGFFLLSFIYSHAHTILLTSWIRREILISLKSMRIIRTNARLCTSSIDQPCLMLHFASERNL
jgi:hypothetical protein